MGGGGDGVGGGGFLGVKRSGGKLGDMDLMVIDHVVHFLISFFLSFFLFLF